MAHNFVDRVSKKMRMSRAVAGFRPGDRNWGFQNTKNVMLIHRFWFNVICMYLLAGVKPDVTEYAGREWTGFIWHRIRTNVVAVFL
jgi:hypothetical protein